MNHEHPIFPDSGYRLPSSLALGKATIRLDQDGPSTLAFINAVQAGYLTYEVYGKHAILTDTDVILLVHKRPRTAPRTPFYQAGFILGTLTMLSQKGEVLLTDQSFCAGSHAGILAYQEVKRSHRFTVGELWCLISWKHRGDNSAYNTGYIVGFTQGLVSGRPSKDVRRFARGRNDLVCCLTRYCR